MLADCELNRKKKENARLPWPHTAGDPGVIIDHVVSRYAVVSRKKLPALQAVNELDRSNAQNRGAALQGTSCGRFSWYDNSQLFVPLEYSGHWRTVLLRLQGTAGCS
mmetsp:Transcript_46261/g.145103  ORF Transcript_46261/g.145103 Transcript_46261/m.145103 type:complete len:107 (+) Transcript_46261:2887-3207(+)